MLVKIIKNVMYVVVFTSPVLVLTEGSANQLESSLVVARVNGHVVYSEDIFVSKESLFKRMVSELGHAPTSEGELRKLNELQEYYQREKFLTIIKVRIRQQQIRRFSILVTEEELLEKWQEVQTRITPGERIRAREEYSRLFDAIKRVTEHGEDADNVYREMVSDRYSEKEWEALLRTWGSESGRKHLARIAFGDGLGLDDYRDAIHQMLIEERLRVAIDDDLVRTDPEYAEYIRLVESDPSAPKVREKPPMYRDAKRYQWWEDRYREADVEIVDDRFKDAWPPK